MRWPEWCQNRRWSTPMAAYSLARNPQQLGTLSLWFLTIMEFVTSVFSIRLQYHLCTASKTPSISKCRHDLIWNNGLERRLGWRPRNMNPTADRFYRSLFWQLLSLTWSVMRACWNHLSWLKKRGRKTQSLQAANLKGPCAQAAILTCSYQGALVVLNGCVLPNHKLTQMEKNSTVMEHHLLALFQSCHAPGDHIACFESYLNTRVPFRFPPQNTLLGYFFLTNKGRETEGIVRELKIICIL